MLERFVACASRLWHEWQYSTLKFCPARAKVQVIFIRDLEMSHSVCSQGAASPLVREQKHRIAAFARLFNPKHLSDAMKCVDRPVLAADSAGVHCWPSAVGQVQGCCDYTALGLSLTTYRVSVHGMTHKCTPGVTCSGPVMSGLMSRTFLTVVRKRVANDSRLSPVWTCVWAY